MGDPVHRTAAIISIGDELTLGQTLDTNSQWLSAQLVLAGVSVRRHATVADDIGVLTDEIWRSAAGHDLVVMTGGLGPTADDLTRQALAEATGDKLITDDGALETLRGWFGRTGREMPAANAVQALRPSGATLLANDNGTAPGLHAVLDGADVYCFPGPPHELRPMFARDVLPSLRTESVVVTRMLRTVGLGESTLAQRLGTQMDRDRNPLVGTTASKSVVTCRIRYEGDDEAEGRRLVDLAEAGVRESLGAYVFGEGDDTLASVIVRDLLQRHEKITTVESCTGGLISAAITDIPGSSAVFERGMVTYSDSVKQEIAGVPGWVFEKQGAVSRTCAESMARGGLANAGADHAIAVTGIAGPDGGTDEKPVGTVWICRASADGTVDARRFQFRGSRDQVRQRTVVMSLAMLRLKLVGADSQPLLWQAEPS